MALLRSEQLRTVGRRPGRQRRQLVEQLVDAARKRVSRRSTLLHEQQTHRPIVNSLVLPFPHLPRFCNHLATSSPKLPELAHPVALDTSASSQPRKVPRLAP